jgi:hypothetical protein
MTNETGEFAFPLEYPHPTSHTGMKPRDYFAAKAIQGMLACPTQPQSGPDMYAKDAYEVADAMLKVREL